MEREHLLHGGMNPFPVIFDNSASIQLVIPMRTDIVSMNSH